MKRILAVSLFSLSFITMVAEAMPYQQLDCKNGESASFNPRTGLLHVDGIAVGAMRYDAAFSVVNGSELQLTSAVEATGPVTGNFLDSVSSKLVLSCTAVLQDTYALELDLQSSAETKFSLSSAYQIGVTPWANKLKVDYGNSFADSSITYQSDSDVLLDNFTGMILPPEAEGTEIVFQFGGGASTFRLSTQASFTDSGTGTTTQGVGGTFDHFSEQGSFRTRREGESNGALNLFDSRFSVQIDLSSFDTPGSGATTVQLTDQSGEFYVSGNEFSPNIRMRIADFCEDDPETGMAIFAYILSGDGVPPFGLTITDKSGNKSLTYQLNGDTGETIQKFAEFPCISE